MKRYIKKVIRKIRKYYYLPRRTLTLKRLFAIMELRFPKKYKKYRNNYVSCVSMNIKRKSLPFGTVFFQEIYDEKNPQKAYNKAKELGASFCILTGKIKDSSSNKIPYVVVKEPHKYFVRFCSWVKKTKRIETIGVTGSVGKTSAKQFICAVLSSKYNIKENGGNMNLRAHSGAYCQTLKKTYDFYVQEVGGCIPNMVRDSAKILQPECFVVTNIGNSHIENYTTQENLIKDKLSIDKYLKKKGIAILNLDDKNIKNNLNMIKHKIVSYSIKNKDADYYAEKIEQKGEFLEVKICYKNGEATLKAHVLGRHNAYNILTAFIVGKRYNMTDDEIQKGLLNYKTDGIRQNLVSVSNRLIYVDCYNAAYNSIKTALETVSEIKLKKGAKKIAVLGDVLEMGEFSVSVHSKIGDLINKSNIDLLITFGDDSKYIATNLLNKVKHIHVDKNRYEELSSLILENTKENDLVLFKASHGMYLSCAIDKAFGTLFYSNEKERYKKTLDSNSFEYKIFGKDLEVEKYKKNEEKIIIPNKYNNYKIVRIRKDAFKKLTATSIKVGEYLRTVSTDSICDMEKLEILDLCECKYIESNAISNCPRLSKINIKNKWCHLSDNFLNNCPNVEMIIPKDFIMIDVLKQNKIKYSFIEK